MPIQLKYNPLLPCIPERTDGAVRYIIIQVDLRIAHVNALDGYTELRVCVVAWGAWKFKLFHHYKVHHHENR